MLVLLLLVVLCSTIGDSDARTASVVIPHHGGRSVHQSNDELRCHCNLPVCVTTGYMCKSSRGTCFSEIVDRTDLSKSRHGCIELLTEQTECQNLPSVNAPQITASDDSSTERPLVLCCKDDLCNYAQQSVLAHHHNHHRINDSAGLVALETRFSSSFSSGVIEVGGGGNDRGHDLWLKAATIAVPIAGGCILVLLVLLAIRLLRRDREAAGEIMIQPSCTKAGTATISPVTARLYEPSKDRQPMLPGGRHHHHHHHIVYLPTVHSNMKSVQSCKSGRRVSMWHKSIMAGKHQQVPVHHV